MNDNLLKIKELSINIDAMKLRENRAEFARRNQFLDDI
jgi:hypothetical protein